MGEDETRFLCGYKRTPRYGTTVTSGQSSSLKPSYNKVIKHKVVPSDTLQGISLKYGSSITEIKRLNKLWSNDSIHLREILNIPVLVEGDAATTTLAVGNNAVNNGATTSDSCYSSMSEGDAFSHSSSSHQNLGNDNNPCSSTTSQLENGLAAAPSTLDRSELSVSDFLDRIDSTIKLTSRNVQRLEKQSTIEQFLNNADSSLVTPSSSKHSFQDVSLMQTPSPPTMTRSGSKSAKIQNIQLQEIHDRFYQL